MKITPSSSLRGFAFQPDEEDGGLLADDPVPMPPQARGGARTASHHAAFVPDSDSEDGDALDPPALQAAEAFM
jgi:hypothetical protein